LKTFLTLARLVAFGLALGVIGELSALILVVPQALLLIPLTRFFGFILLIAAGFALPKMMASRTQRPANERFARAQRALYSRYSGAILISFVCSPARLLRQRGAIV
jgi:uncharacterized membrane protein SpoIIM required for sporulation